MTLQPAPDLPPGTAPQDLVELVRLLRRIPDSARRLYCTPEWAWRRLRVRPDLLTYFAAQGLPHRRDADGLYFDRYDLLNCSLQLGQGTLAKAVRRFWPLALRRAAAGVRAHYEMQYQARCPEPGHAGPCHFRVTLPGGDYAERVVDGDTAAPDASVRVSPEIVWPDLPVRDRSVVDEVDGLEFAVLREEIRWDLDFTRRSGLADCAGGARLLAEAAARRGMTSRCSFGYIVTPPFAVEHYWAEVLVEDVWVPVDPVLIRNMLRWNVLDSAEWPLYRSIGPLVTRVAGEQVPVVLHNGDRVRFTLPVRLLPAPAAP